MTLVRGQFYCPILGTEHSLTLLMIAMPSQKRVSKYEMRRLQIEYSREEYRQLTRWIRRVKMNRLEWRNLYNQSGEVSRRKVQKQANLRYAGPRINSHLTPASLQETSLYQQHQRWKLRHRHQTQNSRATASVLGVVVDYKRQIVMRTSHVEKKRCDWLWWVQLTSFVAAKIKSLEPNFTNYELFLVCKMLRYKINADNPSWLAGL